jgi:hypothetical protein
VRIRARYGRVDRRDHCPIFRSNGAEFILLTLPEKERRDLYRQKKNHKRQPGSALVTIDARLEIDEANFTQSMTKIKKAGGIDVPPGTVNTAIADWEGTKQIEKAGHEITQARAQIQDVGRGYNCESAGFKHTKDFPKKGPGLFEVLDRFNAGDERKPAIEIRQVAVVEIDDVHPLGGVFHQRIGIIAGTCAQPISCANGTDELTLAAADVERFAGKRRSDVRRCNRA